MEVKTFEVRDSMTCMAVVAIKPVPRDEQEAWLWARSGFGRFPGDYVLIADIGSNNGILTSDPYKQNGAPDSRTLFEAHRYIRAHFDELDNGAVVDVEFILGVTDAPKVTDRYYEGS